MPVLCSRFIPSQDVPLYIKGLLPSSTNIIILCGVSISLGVTFIWFLRRKQRIGRTNHRPDERWQTSEDEKRLNTIPSSPLQPTEAHSNRVNFMAETEYNPRDQTMTSMSENPQNDSLDLQRRRSYSSKAVGRVDETNGEIIIAEGWRRHTRVYGGGVCLACVESEERMKAFKLKMQTNDSQEQKAGSTGDKTPEKSAHDQAKPQGQTHS